MPTLRLLEDTFTACAPCSICLEATLDEPLSRGDAIAFQFPNSWTMLDGPSNARKVQTEDARAGHYMQVLAPAGVSFRYEVAAGMPHDASRKSVHGRRVTAVVEEGEIRPGEKMQIVYRNTFAPYTAETDALWVSVKGREPQELPRVTVLPLPAESLRLIAPSGVGPGEEFELLVVSLDKHDNRSATRYENLEIRRDDGALVDAVSFTGGVRVPVRIDAPGVYRFLAGDARSNAVRVEEGAKGPFWGDLHIHTKLSSDAKGPDPFGYAREVSGLDFAATADHLESMGRAGYAQTAAWHEAADRPGTFATIPAVEMNPPQLTGHHNFYFRSIEAFLACEISESSRYGQDMDALLRDITKAPSGDVMIVPHHTGIAWRDLRPGANAAVSLDAWDDRGLRPVMEIYSHHGQSESYAPQHALAYEFNRLRRMERRSNSSVPGSHYAQEYWKNGRKLGVIGSSDEHTCQGGRRHGGIAAVFSDALTREGIFDAIRQRRCYATTGERILVDFSVNGFAMGCAGRVPDRSPLPIRLKVWGTAPLMRVEILRYRFGRDRDWEPVLSAYPGIDVWDAAYELEDAPGACCMYYARITQGAVEWPDMAWTSPVWVED